MRSTYGRPHFLFQYAGIIQTFLTMRVTIFLL